MIKRGVIPAPIFIGVNSSGDPVEKTGFRIKSGMTFFVK